MEERLNQLLAASNHRNSTAFAAEWKRAGGKVIGTACTYVPAELVHAAGFLPWRLSRIGQPSGGLAATYRPWFLSPYETQVLESILDGGFDFLDGLIATNWDDDRRRLWDVATYVRKPAFTHLLALPWKDSEIACRKYATEIYRCMNAIESAFSVVVTREKLVEATRLYDKIAVQMRMLYELRKREVPPLTGGEFTRLTAAAFVLPAAKFCEELDTLLPYLQTRKCDAKALRPRLLVSSDLLDEAGYVDLVEGLGCVVAMDDLETGSRYFWRNVEDEEFDDPVYTLARRYLRRPGCPRMIDWDRQVEQIIRWVREFDIDGVIELPLIHSQSRSLRAPILEAGLAKAGVPFVSFRREYYLADSGQLATRVGAFVEMVRAEEGSKV